MGRSAHIAVVVLLAAACAGGGPRAIAPSGSTLRGTWIDPAGDGTLRPGPGEPMVTRTALAPAARPVRPLATFVQLTDAHVTDAQSPARVEMLDRLGPPFTSAFRPQETLTTQVLAAMVQTIDTVHPEAVFETGDLIDNDQQNELSWALTILRGGVVRPDSGAPGYQGVQAASNPDPLFYRPTVDAPRYPGLLAAALRPVRSPGLHAPWYPLPGNHDLLVQGNVPATRRIRAIATGSRKLVTVDRAALEAAHARRLSVRIVGRLLAHGLPGASVAVVPDPARREPAPAQVVARLRRASGHGGTGPLMDQSVDIGPSLRVVMLDTTDRHGGAAGILRPAQVAWLRGRLRGAGDRFVVIMSGAPLPEVRGGAAALALLDGDARVVAAVAGDVHRNSIRPRRTSAGGYWLVTTSSLADYPQQARAFRLVATAGGGVELETWMLNADPRSHLADVSRRLAYLDYQGGRPNRWAGRPGDRNARLFVPAPAP